MPHNHQEWTGDRGFPNPKIFQEDLASTPPPPAVTSHSAVPKKAPLPSGTDKKSQSADEPPSTPGEAEDEKQGSEALE
jgi:hypothetical protein